VWRVSLNPYESIDWRTATQYHTNLHTHSTESDGSHSVSDVIDMYRGINYKVLAITDHDYSISATTWPWSDYGRDPAALGMIAIEGQEASRRHHILSLFSPYWAASYADEIEALSSIETAGGLSVICHPTMHNKPFDWYKPLFETQKALLGVEVANGTRPVSEWGRDKQIWDYLITALGANRPIWGFAVDDMHGSTHFHRGWINLIADELSAADDVRELLIAGGFTWSCSYSGSHPVPKILSVETDSRKIIVRAKDYDQIQWYSEGILVGEGDTFWYRNSAKIRGYIRAEAVSSRGVSGTQPIYLESEL
jgi:hypothetical protein